MTAPLQKGDLFRLAYDTNYTDIIHTDLEGQLCMLGDPDTMDPKKFYWHPSGSDSLFVIIVGNIAKGVIPRFAYVKKSNLQELSAHELAQAHIQYGDLIERSRELIRYERQQ